MGQINNISRYLKQHSLRKISVGKSGADVYELDNLGIAKYIQRNRIRDDSMWEAYERETMFYSCFSETKYPFIPTVLYNERNDDEILLVLKKYHPIERKDVNCAMLRQILEYFIYVLAPIPAWLFGEAGARNL